MPTWLLRSRGCRTTARRVFLLFAAAFLATAHGAVRTAYPTIPKESIAALGTQRSKPTRQGVVFVSGMMLEPTYTVKRIGTGIFIRDGKGKDHQITGQVRNWKRFLATQGGVSAGKDEEDLDDFFDDDDDKEALKPVKGRSSDAKAEPLAKPSSGETPDRVEKPVAESETPAAPERPAATAETKERPSADPAPVPAGLEGSFVPNKRSRALLKDIDVWRMKFDKALRSGAMLFFSPSRRHLKLDARTAVDTLEKLVEAMKETDDARSMARVCRNKGLTLFGEEECAEFLANRRLLPQMEERAARLRKEAATNRLTDF